MPLLGYHTIHYYPRKSLLLNFIFQQKLIQNSCKRTVTKTKEFAHIVCIKYGLLNTLSLILNIALKRCGSSACKRRQTSLLFFKTALLCPKIIHSFFIHLNQKEDHFQTSLIKFIYACSS